MKEKIKEAIASLVYWLYQIGILKNKIHVHSVDETIDTLIDSDKSLVRFGDGEIVLIAGIASATQQGNEKLGKELAKVLASNEEKLLVAVYDVFEGMNHLHKNSQLFWKKHLLKFRKYYDQYCDKKRVYYNTFISRCYYSFEDRSQCVKWFDKIKDIWKDKDVVVVEGEQTHNGVGNDLLDRAKSVKRLIGPSKNAFDQYDEILKQCLAFDQSQLFLLSIGATAKPLAYDLVKKGYRVIDIGNMDMEYEWFLRRSPGKMELEKHSVLGIENNHKAEYEKYLSEITLRIK